MRQIIQSISVLLVILGAMPAWSAGTDELWAVTTTMNMPGMAMPGMTMNVCIPKGGAYKPANDKDTKNCQVTDYKVSGNKVTWKMQCTGKEAMSGTGEMTKTADAMKGVFKMHAEGMDMTQVMDGKRAGTCDAAEEKKAMDKMVADSKTQAEESIKKSCEDSVKRDAESGGMAQGGDLYHGKGLCAAYRQELCTQARARAGTYAGYSAYLRQRKATGPMSKGSGWVISECGIDLEKQRLALCQQAVKDKKYRFIGAYCPPEAKTLTAQYCAGFGMDYTADMARPNHEMCFALRNKADDSGERTSDSGTEDAPKSSSSSAGKSSTATETKGTDNPAAKAMDAAKKLKGMFGF